MRQDFTAPRGPADVEDRSSANELTIAKGFAEAAAIEIAVCIHENLGTGLAIRGTWDYCNTQPRKGFGELIDIEVITGPRMQRIWHGEIPTPMVWQAGSIGAILAGYQIPQGVWPMTKFPGSTKHKYHRLVPLRPQAKQIALFSIN